MQNRDKTCHASLPLEPYLPIRREGKIPTDGMKVESRDELISKVFPEFRLGSVY